MEQTSSLRKRVLVVEDERYIRALLAECLREGGYAADTVEDGAAALDAVRQSPPDLILLDLMMPVLDGLGFLQQAQAITGFDRVPVVVLSAAYGLAEAGRAFPHQVRATLGKPFDLDVLMMLVDHLLTDDVPAAPRRAASEPCADGAGPATPVLL